MSNSSANSNWNFPNVAVIIVVIIGLLCALAALFLTLTKPGMTSSDIVATVGLFTGITGTLVGTLLGYQSGSTGKDTVIEKYITAKAVAETALSMLPVSAKVDELKVRLGSL